MGQLAHALRQLATLTRAGIPLVEALLSLKKQQSNDRMRSVFESLRMDIVEGGDLASAMRSHPDIFPSMYNGMVQAGEASGALDEVLDRIAAHAEADARLRARLKSAMTYPAVMGVVGTGIVLFLLAYVVPQITRVFAESNQVLPLPTRLLMGLAEILAGYGIPLALLLAVAALALRYYAQTPGGRRRFERLLFALPVVGKLSRNVAMARFSHTLSTLLAGGLPLVEALTISRAAVGNSLISDALEEATTAVSEGEPLAPRLGESGLFNVLVVDMVAVGERSGELGSMLMKASAALDEEVDLTVESLASLMEPAMILVMAAMVLFVLLAIMLPVFEMNQLVR